MQLHLIGGFLGSGKTTAIAAAARLLMEQDQRVGVITNDQGQHLVDTAFLRQANVPAVEVTGGCFCCNYDDLEERLTGLMDQHTPDVIFAESVGSCADMVATVIKPLINLQDGLHAPASFTVFADIRLVRQRLKGLPMPFSENVTYIFDQQLTEAGLIILNKQDLLSPEDGQETLALAAAAYPDKVIRIQNTLDHDEVAEWLALLDSTQLDLPQQSLRMDYKRYGTGEAELAWLDELLTLTPPIGSPIGSPVGSPDQARAATIQTIQAIADAIHTSGTPIGHLKFFVTSGESQAKISFTTLASANEQGIDKGEWQEDIPELNGPDVQILVNARVQSGIETLGELVHEAVAAALPDGGYQWSDGALFHPGQPNPTHRVA